MDPVDPRAPLGRVDGTDGTEKQHRDAVAPRVEYRHGRMHEADVRVQRDRERAPGDARIPVRERDRVLLVDAQQELRPRVAEIVDEAVVQAAKARAGRERDVRDLERSQQFRDRIAAPGGGGLCLRSVARGVGHACFAARLHGIEVPSRPIADGSTVAHAATRGKRGSEPR